MIQEKIILLWFYRNVYGSKKLDNFIQHLFMECNDNKNKELCIIHYKYLKKLFKLIIKN